MDQPTVPPVRLQHGLFFYRAPAEFIAAVLGFVQDGVAAGEAVLVAATGPDLVRLRAQLDGQSEHVTWADMSGTGINPRRITAAMRAFAEDHPGRPLRYVQEPAWPTRAPAELCEVIRHEALVNLALAGLPASILCGYDTRLPAATLASAERVHPLLAEHGQWRPSPPYTPAVPIPPDCDQPLGLPPAAAAVLAYREDQVTVRRFAAEQAELAGLPGDRVMDLVIAIGELAGNTLAHTRGPGTLAVWTTGGELVCQLHDSGEIADPLAGSRRPDPAAPGGGRGLWVVHQLCDLVETRSGPAGTTTRLHMRLPPEPLAARPGGRPGTFAAGPGR
ncbi:MAG: anti-sigma factor RsbA family regulatory protein [Gemmatimonadota bacterium]